jgi:hypothetical protein
MKINTKLFIVTILLLFSLNVKADQLISLTKSQSVSAVDEFQNLEYVYLYCGCCKKDKKELVKVLNVQSKMSDTGDSFNVVLTYQNKSQAIKSEIIDLAYVWALKEGKQQTIAELLNLNHAPCKRLKKKKWVMN